MAKRQLDKQLRDKIAMQACQEIDNNMQYKRNIVYKRWQRNEEIYFLATNWYGINKVPVYTRGTGVVTWQPPRVDLGKGIGFIQTLASKQNDDSIFEYKAVEISDEGKATDLNAIKEQDSNIGRWKLKRRAARKAALLYGRQIFEYFATEDGGYKSVMNPIHPYNFLIDPACGGLNVQDAQNCGHYAGYVPTKELRDGVKKGIYIKKEVDRMIGEGEKLGGFTTQSEIDTLKQNKYSLLDLQQSDRDNGKSNQNVQMWKWYTTYDGIRYYVYLNKETGIAVRVEELTNIFPASKKIDERGLYPYATSATDPDIDVFFGLAPIDQVANMFLMQNIAIEQMIENYYKINRPQKFIALDMIDGLNAIDLQYSPNKTSFIQGTGGRPIDEIIQHTQTVELTTPTVLYDKLDFIQGNESAVNQGAKGASDEDKVGIYEGNMAQTADRYALLEKNLSDSDVDLGVLHYCGVIDRMKPDFAISYIGSEGLSVRKVISDAKTLEPEAGRFDFSIKSTSAEDAMDRASRKDKLTFITQNMQSFKNPAYAVEIAGKAVGLGDDDIKSLMNETGALTKKLISSVFADMKKVIAGKMKLPPVGITSSYMEAMNLWRELYYTELTKPKRDRLSAYLDKVTEEIMSNEMRESLNNQDLSQIEEQPPEEQMQEQPEAQMQDLQANLETNI